MSYLDQLEQQLNDIRGNWNGKDSGLAEDRAGYAEDALEHIKELRELIEELS